MAKNENKTTENNASVEAFLNQVADEKKKADSFEIKAKSYAEVLVIEVPMEF